MGRHRVAIVVLGGTFVLDLAVAVQAFGRRPSVFSKIRDEPEAPYEVGDLRRRSRPDLTRLQHRRPEVRSTWIAGADTVLVPGLE